MMIIVSEHNGLFFLENERGDDMDLCFSSYQEARDEADFQNQMSDYLRSVLAVVTPKGETK